VAGFTSSLPTFRKTAKRGAPDCRRPWAGEAVSGDWRRVSLPGATDYNRDCMKLRLKDYENGVREHWTVIESRSACVQDIENLFPQFAAIYASRTPPHFTKGDLEKIIEWKHSKDNRRRTNALEGLKKFPDERIVGLTCQMGDDIEASMKPLFCKSRYAGEVFGIGVATMSAILTAARPDLFAVIDTYALAAIYHHYNFPWLYKLSRNEKGELLADWNSYPPFVGFCRAEAAKLTMTNKVPWTPRKIEMALWGIGKKLEESGLL
jgi:hypothetical protein